MTNLSAVQVKDHREGVDSPSFCDSYDLSNLTFVEAKQVEEFVERVNNLSTARLANKTLVLAIGAGGTISMSSNADGVRSPALNFGEIFDHADPWLQTQFMADAVNAFALDSSQLDYQHVADLAIIISYVSKHVTIPFAGFLISHGTDTISFSSAALAMMLGQSIPYPVVFTGAQIPIQEDYNDARDNVRDAMLALRCAQQQNVREVMIVMGGEAFLAVGNEKAEDEFRNNSHGEVIGTDLSSPDYSFEFPCWVRRANDEENFQPRVWKQAYGGTLVFTSFLGLNPDMMRGVMKRDDVHSAVLQTYHTNTVYQDVIDVLVERTVENNKMVYMVNPYGADATRVAYESTQAAMEKAFVALNISLPALLAKIELAQRLFDGNREAIAQFMREQFIGEIRGKSAQSFVIHR